MPQSNPISPNPDAPVFTATIVPYRSLSTKGFSLLMGFVGFVGLATSVPFYLMGAWPVVGFMGIDIALIYIAFRASYASARAYEQIVLTRLDLLFRSVSWRGHQREVRFNALWTRIEREEHPEFGTERVTIVQGRQREEVAASLGRAARGDFADAFERALASAKRQ